VARDVVPGSPTYSVVDELIVREPLVVGPGTPVGEVARRMTEADLPAAVVRVGDGCFGLVTDAMLRARVLAAGRRRRRSGRSWARSRLPSCWATPPRKR
jgi:CBS domain-containing protein